MSKWTKFTMSKWTKLIIGGIVIVLVGCIPFETVVVPRWSVAVVNEQGKPLVGYEVVEECENYTLSENPCRYASDRVLVTDERGVVSFSERRVRLSLWMRIYRSTINFLLILAHGSYGSYIYLSTADSELWYDWRSVPSTFVIRSKVDRR